MKIKIISDGKFFNTKIVNADTGESIQHVISCQIFMDAKNDSVVRAVIEFIDVELEIKTNALLKELKLDKE